jgi:hypothetical protein
MDFSQRVAAAIAGAESPATADTIQSTHDRLAELLGIGGDFTTEPGVKLGLADAFPDSEVFAKPEIAETLRSYRAYMLTGFDDRNVFRWLDYALCRWAAAGLHDDLRELVRIALHRDGSSAAIEVGGSMLEVMRAAADQSPAFQFLLASAGLDVNGSTPFANLPFGSLAASQLTRPKGLAGNSRLKRGVGGRVPPRAARPVVTPPAAPAAAEPATVADVAEELRTPEAFQYKNPAGELLSIPFDHLATIGREGSQVGVLAFLVSPKMALMMAEKLLDVVHGMLLPGPGFTWRDDDTAEGKSVLAFNDGKTPEFIAAEVAPHEGGFICCVFGFGGAMGGNVFPDIFPKLSDAKIAAADWVRAATDQA